VLSALGTGATCALALRAPGAGLPWARLARIALAALLAAAPLWPLRALEPPLLALALGGIGYGVLYPAALWLLRGLAADDARFIAALWARVRARLRGQAGA
jgi:hypothetical protein